MNRIIKSVFLLLSASSVVFANSRNFDLSLRVQMKEASGNPVADASVSVGFVKSYMNEKSTQVKGVSDQDGFFETKALSSGTVGIAGEKAGYYKSRVKHNFFIDSKGKLSPYDPSVNTIKILMRRKLNPIPMYAKRVTLELPAEEQYLGFDLEKGDWVSPYGAGGKSDFTFYFSRILSDDRTYDAALKMRFNQDQDGIQLYEAPPLSGSKLRLPNSAPSEGYTDKLDHEFGWNKAQGHYGVNNPDTTLKNYFFRVRTVVDEKGEIISSHYGKVYGTFRISGARRDKVRLSFTYYFNPNNNDTNVEFDPEKNLFKNLKYDEEVRNP